MFGTHQGCFANGRRDRQHAGPPAASSHQLPNAENLKKFKIEKYFHRSQICIRLQLDFRCTVIQQSVLTQNQIKRTCNRGVSTGRCQGTTRTSGWTGGRTIGFTKKAAATAARCRMHPFARSLQEGSRDKRSIEHPQQQRNCVYALLQLATYTLLKLFLVD